MVSKVTFAKGCRTASHNHIEACANYFAGRHNANNTWVVDSGSTHHLTADSEGLDDYMGSEEITLSDGSKIPITHIGLKNVDAAGTTFRLDSTYCAPLSCEGSRDSDAVSARTREARFI